MSMGRSRIQTKLMVWFLLFSLVPVAVIGILSFNVYSSALQHRLYESKRSSMYLASKNIESKLDAVDRYVEIIVYSREIQERISKDTLALRFNNDPVIDHVLASTFRKDGIIDCALLETGNGLVYSYGGLLDRRTGLHETEWYRNLTDGSSWRWQAPVKSPNLAGRFDTVFPVGADIYNRFVPELLMLSRIGTLVLCLREDVFNNDLSSLQNDAQHDAALLFDADGVFVTGMGLFEDVLDALNGWRDGMELQPGAFTSITRGNRMISAYRTPYSGFTVISATSKNDELGDLNRIGVIVIMTCIILTALSTILSRYAAGKYTRPIIAVCDAMRRFSDSDMNIDIGIRTHDEMDEVIIGLTEMSEQIKRLFVQVANRDREKRHAMQRALHYQMNPHFLYNSLSAIRFMAIENDQSHIADTLSALSRYLRNTLSREEFIVTLKQELDLLADYLYLEKIRHDGALDITYDIEPETLMHLVPATLLQPIAENAILHGLMDKINLQTGDANITITSRMTGNDLAITIADNGAGITRQRIDTLFDARLDVPSEDHFGLALPNIRERLCLAFGEKASITVDSRLNEYTRIAILIKDSDSR